jgi:hypothetical protein
MTSAPGEGDSLPHELSWNVYTDAFASRPRDYLGVVFAPVYLEKGPAQATFLAVAEARRQFMTLLRDDDVEVELAGPVTLEDVVRQLLLAGSFKTA